MSNHWKLVLIDLTTDATPADLRPKDILTGLVDASEDLLRIFGQATGYWPAVEMRVGHAPDDRKHGEVVAYFRDTLDVQGALAYHTVTNGVPDIEVGCSLFNSSVVGSDSLSVGFTHELLEFVMDPGANGWKDNGEGEMDAEEECDWVQNLSFVGPNGMHVTDFVLRSFFVPGADGPWDYMGAMSSRGDVTHGYGIQAVPPTNVTQIPGSLAEQLAALAAPLPKTRRPFERMNAGRRVYLHGHTNLSELALKRKASPHSRTTRRLGAGWLIG